MYNFLQICICQVHFSYSIIERASLQLNLEDIRELERNGKEKGDKKGGAGEMWVPPASYEKKFYKTSLEYFLFL